MNYIENKLYCFIPLTSTSHWLETLYCVFVCYHQAGYINVFSCVNIAYVLTTLEMNYVAYELYGI